MGKQEVGAHEYKEMERKASELGMVSRETDQKSKNKNFQKEEEKTLNIWCC